MSTKKRGKKVPASPRRPLGYAAGELNKHPGALTPDELRVLEFQGGHHVHMDSPREIAEAISEHFGL